MTLLTTSGDIHAATMATSHFIREKRKVKSEESACLDISSWVPSSWGVPLRAPSWASSWVPSSWGVPLRAPSSWVLACGDSMCSCSPLILTVAARSAM